MTATELATMIDKLEALAGKATHPVKHSLYEHGGSRSYGPVDASGASNELVADFYKAADRDYWIATIRDLPTVLKLLRAAMGVCEAYRATQGWDNDTRENWLRVDDALETYDAMAKEASDGR